MKVFSRWMIKREFEFGQAGISHNRGKGVVEVVRHSAGQTSYNIHLLAAEKSHLKSITFSDVLSHCQYGFVTVKFEVM